LRVSHFALIALTASKTPLLRLQALEYSQCDYREYFRAIPDGFPPVVLARALALDQDQV